MQADKPVNQATETLKTYISELLSSYEQLIAVLSLEADDIRLSDEFRLDRHVEMEREIVKQIISLTKSVRTYINNTEAGEEELQRLSAIAALKNRASTMIEDNIASLRTEMSRLKSKIASVKLPQSARRVYYSGNNPTLMDIEI